MKTFLIDENVNQKALRLIPIAEKNFDFLYPEDGGLKGLSDFAMKKKAAQENRVLVTCDRDFDLPIAQLPDGVLWIRPSPRVSQRRVGELIQKFCAFVQKAFPDDPYNFKGRIFEIYEFGVTIRSEQGSTDYTF